MANNISNNNRDTHGTSIDHQLICTICNKPFNDSPSFPCNHRFCQQCMTQELQEKHISCPNCHETLLINDFQEVHPALRKKINDLPVKFYKDQQTILCSENIHDPINKASSENDEKSLFPSMLHHQNEQQDQGSIALLFDPFRSLLNDPIRPSRQPKEKINESKEQHQLQLTEQLRNNEQLQHEIDQFKEQAQLQLTEQSRKYEQLQHEIDQLEEQSQLRQHALTEQLNEQSRNNEQLRHEIDQLEEQSQLRQHALTEQLNEQSRNNEQLQHYIDQFKKQTQLFFIVLFLFVAVIYLSPSGALTKQIQLQQQVLTEKLNEQSTNNEELQRNINRVKEQSELQQQTLAKQLTEQSIKNEELQREINQVKEQSRQQQQTLTEQLTEQSIKNEELQREINQVKEQSRLQQQTLAEQLAEQSRKNEELQREISQLNTKITELTTHTNTLHMKSVSGM